MSHFEDVGKGGADEIRRLIKDLHQGYAQRAERTTEVPCYRDLGTRRSENCTPLVPPDAATVFI